MKAIQDSGRPDIWSEAAYAVPKQRTDEHGMTLKTMDYRSGAAQARPLLLLDGDSSAVVSSFWNSPPNPTGRQIAAAEVKPCAATIEGMKIQAFEVCHSLPGCRAIQIESSDALVVYTGDIRFHGCLEESSRAFVRAMAARKPTVFICEGTRLGRKTSDNVTEIQVEERAYEIARAATGRLIIADFGARHVERLSAFLRIAEQTGRMLVLTGKDFYLLQALQIAAPSLNLLQRQAVRMYDKPRGSMEVWEGKIRETYAAKMVGTDAIKKQPGDYILAFSFWDVNELVDLEPAGAVYIYSSSEAYNEDSIIDLRRLWNWLSHFGFEVHGFRWDDSTGLPVFAEGLNASGHLSEEDLRWMLSEIKPEYVLPVHTSRVERFHELIEACGSKVALLSPDGRFSV